MQTKAITAFAATFLNIYVNAGVHFPMDLQDGIYKGDLSPTPNFSLIAHISNSTNTTTTLVPRGEDRLGPPDQNRDTVCGNYEMNTKEVEAAARRMTKLAEDITWNQKLLEHNTIMTIKLGTSVVYICAGEQTEMVVQGKPSEYKEWIYAWHNMQSHCGWYEPFGSLGAHFTYHTYKRVWGRANQGAKFCDGVMNKDFMKWDEKTDEPWKKPLPGVDW